MRASLWIGVLLLLAPLFSARAQNVASPDLAAPSTGYQIGGVAVLNVFGAATSPAQSLAVGPGAGAALGTASTYSTFLGAGSGNSFNSNAQKEVTCTGAQSAYLLTNVSDNITCMGLWSLHYANTSADVGIVSFGDNNMRNAIGATGSASFGSNAYADNFGYWSNGFGYETLHGNAASLLFGGTFTAGDVITLTFTSSAISGGSGTSAYTVQAGDTCTSVVNAFYASVGASGVLGLADVKSWTATDLYPCVLAISFRGSSTQGTVLTVTASVSGSQTETVAITGGSYGPSNNAVGYEAMFGLQMVGAASNNCMGRRCLASLTSGDWNDTIGEESGLKMAGSIASDAMGYWTLHSMTSGFFADAFGFEAGESCTTCQNVTLIGAYAGQTSLTTAAHVVIITSAGDACDTNTSNTFRLCGAGGAWFSATGTGTASTSVATFAGSVAPTGGIIPASGLSNGFYGTTGDTVFLATDVSSGVNYVQIKGAATGNPPLIATAGSDGTVGMAFGTTKGAGAYQWVNSSGQVELNLNGVAGAVSYPNISPAASGNILIDVGGTATGISIGASAATLVRLGSGSADQILGSGSNLSALSATAGFAHIPFTNATSGTGGIPTGTPANTSGPACVWNDVTFVLDCYSPSAAAWKHVAFSANAG
jgi:hypothetical protein